MEAAVDGNQPNRHRKGLKDIEDVCFKNLTDENDVVDDEIDENYYNRMRWAAMKHLKSYRPGQIDTIILV